jgi:hypothetical protein
LILALPLLPSWYYRRVSGRAGRVVRLEWGSAKAAAAFRGRTPVRLKMLSMCSLIVDTEMNRILAMSALL